MVLHLKWAKRLKTAGEAIEREGLSQRAVTVMIDLVTKTSSLKAAMVAVGRMKAIAQAAKYDDYWTEQVETGFIDELHKLEHLARQKRPLPSPPQKDEQP